MVGAIGILVVFTFVFMFIAMIYMGHEADKENEKKEETAGGDS